MYLLVCVHACVYMGTCATLRSCRCSASACLHPHNLSASADILYRPDCFLHPSVTHICSWGLGPRHGHENVGRIEANVKKPASYYTKVTDLKRQQESPKDSIEGNNYFYPTA